MLYRWLTYSAVDGGGSAGGSAPAPSSVATPAPVAASTLAPVADQSEIYARLDKLAAQIESVTSGAARLEADKNASDAKALTVEQQLSELRASAAADKVDGALGRAVAGVKFASPRHAEHGLAVFRANHKIEVRDGAVLATGRDGKAQHIDNAFAAWAKGEGSLYVESAAQPGPAGVATAPIQGASALGKPIKDMDDAEFFSAWRSGKMPDGTPIRGKLTPGDRNAPTFEFQSQQNPYAQRREAVNTAFRNLMTRGNRQ